MGISLRFAVAVVLVSCVHVDGGSFEDVTEEDLYSKVVGAVAAMGDYNSDHYTDTISVSAGVVTVHNGRHDGEVLATFYLACTTQCVATNVIAGDLNWDGLLDIVVQYMYADEKDPPGAIVLQNVLFLQNPDGSVTDAIQLPPTVDHLLAANLWGKMHIDLVGTFKHGSEMTAMLVQNVGCPEEKVPQGCTPVFDCKVGVAWPLTLDIPGCRDVQHLAILEEIDVFSFLGDSATADLDGNCRGDIVVSHQTAEQRLASATSPQNRTFAVWDTVQIGSPPFVRTKVWTVAAEVGFVTFRDVDSDGDMDMVALFCDTTQGGFTCIDPTTHQPRYNSIMVAPNTQPKSACSDYHCCFTQDYSYPDISTADAVRSSGAQLTLLAAGMYAAAGTWGALDFGGEWIYPPTVNMADYNNDRAVDIVMNVMIPQDASPAASSSLLLKGDGSTMHFLEDSGSAVSELMSINSGTGYTVQKAFFYDMSEEGTADLLVMVVKDNANTTALKAFANELHLSNRLFFNALGLNGRCPSGCSTSPKSPSPRPYGVNMPGVTHKLFFKVPDHMKSKNVYLIATQLTTSTQLALQRPYASWGLGAINSYIEIYFCGAHIEGVKSPYKSWPALLPNSQVVVIDYPMDSPSKWKIEQVVNPSKYTKWIALTTGLACIALSIPVFFLRCRELREDAVDRQKERPMMPL